MTLAAVDPGKNEFYLAEFDRRQVGQKPELVYVGRSPRFPTAITELVIEKPRIYPRGHKRPNDIVDLAWEGGRICGRFETYFTGCRIIEVYPAQWKGQVAKEIHHLRVLRALNAAELAVLPPDATERVQTAAEYHVKTGKHRYNWEGHNLLDAIGIGLKHLGRIP